MSDPHDHDTNSWDVNDPIDLSAVNRDDRFVEALSHDRPVPTHDDTEYELAELLSGWRHDVVTTPPPVMPSVDEVAAAMAVTERKRKGRGMIRHLRVASGAAAIVVIAGAGLTVLAEGSSPGDPLWGVKAVVFASQATQTQASMDVQSNLEKAEAAVAAGNTAEAAELIAKAQVSMKPLDKGGTRDRMNDWISRLEATTASTTEQSRTVPKRTAKSSDATTLPPDIRRQGTTDDRSVRPTTPGSEVTSPETSGPVDARPSVPPTSDSTPPTAADTTTPRPSASSTGGSPKPSTTPSA